MSSKIGNDLPLFRKWEASLFTSGLLHNFTQIKVIEVCLTEGNLHLKTFVLITQKYYREIGIIIAIT